MQAWIFDEYTKFAGFSPGIVTGKVRAGSTCNSAMQHGSPCLLPPVRTAALYGWQQAMEA